MAKRCSKCKLDLDLDLFHKNKSEKDGRSHECRSCCKERRRIGYADGRYNYRDKLAECRDRIRRETFAAYGTSCACCGEDYQRFLTIDHINGDGALERKYGKRGGIWFYKSLKDRGFPSGYQTLCYNCNCAKGTGKECPCPYALRKRSAC